jgi:hypothetical protein
VISLPVSTAGIPSIQGGRFIGVACGAVTIKGYVDAWRRVLEAPAGKTFKRSLCGMDPASREEILREYSFGVHDRINRHIPWFGRGRKWDEDWQRAMLQAAQTVNRPRLIIDWLPQDLVRRFAHRLRRNRDDL